MTAKLAPTSVVSYRSHLQKVTLEGNQLAYVDAGPRKGRVILLLHGLPTSSWLYRNISPALANAGFRVIVPDLIGFGASDKPISLSQYSPDKQAARILALMRELDIDQWTHVCHDLGGMWTWEIIDTEPRHVERLVILNTTAYSNGFEPPGKMRMVGGFLGPLMLGMMRSRFMGRSLTRSFFKEFTAHPERMENHVIDIYWWSLHEGTTHALRQVASNFDFYLGQFDRYQKALRRLHVPATVIWGKKDPALNYAKIPAQFARDLNIPSESIHVIGDASHFVQEDQSTEVASLISTFVKEASGN